MPDNYSSPLLLSNNTPIINYSNNHVINPMQSENNKSYNFCDRSNIKFVSLIVFVTLFIIFLIIYFK